MERKDGVLSELTVEEIKKMNIYERVSRISNEIKTVAKNLRVTNYKAVGEADVLREIKPIEFKYRVFSYPHSREIVENGIWESGSNKKALFERVATTYRFINIDNPIEFIDTIAYGDGIDTQDKSVGKAVTYSDKYALLKFYKIETGDDPDQEESKEMSGLSVNPVRTNKPVDRTNYKDLLVTHLRRLGININTFAIQHQLSSNSTQDDFKRAVDEVKDLPTPTKTEEGK